MIKTTPRTHVQFCEHIPFEKIVIHGSYPQHTIRNHVYMILASSKIIDYLVNMVPEFEKQIEAYSRVELGKTASGGVTKKTVYPKNLLDYLAKTDSVLSGYTSPLSIKNDQTLKWALGHLHPSILFKMFDEISQTYNKFWATYGEWFPSNKETFQYFENDGRIIIQPHGKMEVKCVISAITQTLGNCDNPSSLLLQDLIDPYGTMI